MQKIKTFNLYSTNVNDKYECQSTMVYTSNMEVYILYLYYEYFLGK